MKLLFDGNLSPALVDALHDLYPLSIHVGDLLSAGATDSQLWDAAAKQGFAIVSKDNDFRQRSFVAMGGDPCAERASVSFIDACRATAAWALGIEGAVALITNPLRPGCSNPRVIRRRPKNYTLLTTPRSEWKCRENTGRMA